VRRNASIASLTGIRGVAAVWVMLYHIQSFSPEFGLPFLRQIPLFGMGWAGVDLFFLLSGFILFYVHGEQFRRLSWVKLRDFAVLRVLRVYPPAAAALLIILAIVIADPGFAHWYPAIHSRDDLTPGAFVRTLFLTTRWYPPFVGDWNQPTWSLSAEIVGYCGFPFAALLITRYVNAWAGAALALMTIAFPPVLKLLLNDHMDNDLFGFALIRMAGYFLGGMALCRFYRLTPRLSARLADWLGGAAIVAIVVISIFPAAAGYIAFAFGLLIFSLASGVGLVDRLLASPVAMFLGRISFPLYLIHVMALMWLRYLIQSQHIGWPYAALCLVLYVVIVMGAAYALHLFVERPFQRWSHSLVRRRPADGPASPEIPRRSRAQPNRAAP
jgi:peptidoglycan/LPS O-acetylase OafA/YrhL